MELYYRRVESSRKGRTVPARTQTVVIFLPDVRSCLPTRLEWDELNIKYKTFLDQKRQSNNSGSSSSKELEDCDKKQAQIKSDDAANDDGDDDDDVEMADESNKEEMDQTTNSGGGDSNECQENVADSSETKVTATDCESKSATTSTAAISKALLNIISNFLHETFFFL